MVEPPSPSAPVRERAEGPETGILGIMTPYHFVTTLRVTASLEAVYWAIAEPAWVEDWGDAVRVERRQAADEVGWGSCFDATVRAPLGYHLSARIETIEADPWSRLRMQATGSVVGTGTWEITANGGATDVRFDWDVSTTERWMDMLAPVARPVFERSHGIVMRHAARTAADHLGAELLHFDSRALPV